MRLYRPGDPRSGQSVDLELDEAEEAERAVPAVRFPGRATGVNAIVYRAASGAALRADARAALAKAASRSGQALPEALRRQLERALAVDLSGVRIHTGPASQDAAAAVGATAYTVGQDIHFAAGKYQPETPSGFKLVVHEIAHTVQQGQATGGDLTVSSPGDAVEREAERIAERISAEPDAVHLAAGVDAIRPVAAHDDQAGARLAGARHAVRQAETPGALPMTISHQVSGMLMRDDAPAADPQADGEPVGPKSGSVADETFDPGPGGGGCDLHGAGCGGGHELKIVANFNTVPVVSRGAFEGGSVGHDSIGGSLSSGSSIGRGGGIPGSAFGKATPKYSTKGMAWTVAGNTVTVTGQVFVDVKWDVQSRGRISIETAEDGVLGPGNFMQAFYDLQQGSHPARDMFWVQSLTEQHEMVHVNEYIANTAKETPKAAEWLTSQPIKVPKKDEDKGVQDQLDPLIKQIAMDVGNAVIATFGSGGEERAYATGAAAYTALADAIKARGTKMKWDDKKGTVAPDARPGHRPEDDEDGQDSARDPSSPVMRDASGGDLAADARARLARASSSQGQPLPDALRASLEGSLSADLSQVRVHTGTDSVVAAEAVGANAYTVGSDVHFGDGKYDPSSAAGQRLLAHEVAHTVQQHGAGTSTGGALAVSSPGDAHEVEAHRFADAFAGGEKAAVHAVTPGVAARDVIHRDGDPNAPIIKGLKIPFTLAKEFEIKKGKFVKLNKISVKLEGTISSDEAGGTPTGGPAGGSTSSTDTKGKDSKANEVKLAAEVKEKAESKVLEDIHNWVAGLISSTAAEDEKFKTEAYTKKSGEVKMSDKGQGEYGGKLAFEVGVDQSLWGVGKLSFAIAFTAIGYKYSKEKAAGTWQILAVTPKVGLSVKKKDWPMEKYSADLKGSVEAEFEPDWVTIAEAVLPDLLLLGAAEIFALLGTVAVATAPLICLAAAIQLGELENDMWGKVRDGARDVKGAAFTYGNVMVGSDGGGSSAAANQARAKGQADLAGILAKTNTTMAEYKTLMTKDTSEFSRIYNQTKNLAMGQFSGRAHAAIDKWKSEHWVVGFFKDSFDLYAKCDQIIGEENMKG